MNEYLPDEIVVIHQVLSAAAIPHAFGGAIALAYWGTPRYTHDVDINIALTAAEYAPVLDALARAFPLSNREKAEREVRTTAQTRLRWGTLPVDLFFANTPFHEAMATRIREVDYTGTTIPVLSAEDLIICKALFNRPKDWFDIENIVKVQAYLDVGHLHYWLQDFAEPEEERLLRLDRLLQEYRRGGDSAGA